jgi:hypothetical protein
MSRIIASLSYIFNLFFISIILTDSLILAYVFNPLFIGIIIRGINADKRYDLFYICLTIVVEIFLFTSIANLATYVVIWLLVFVFLFFYFSVSHNKVRIIKFSAKLIALSIFVNMWWIIPLLIRLFTSTTEGLTNNDIINVDWIIAKSTQTSLLNLFVFKGKWAWFSGVGDSLYYPYSIYYSQLLPVVVGYFLTTIGLSVILLANKFDKINQKIILYLAFVYLFGLFLLKGAHPPLESLNLLLYEKIPFFLMFREGYNKFMVISIIILALFIGKTHEHIYAQNIAKHTITIVFIMAIFINGWPLINGDVIIKDRGTDLPSDSVDIPKEWLNLNNNLEDNLTNRIFITPINPSVGIIYTWGYKGVDRTPRFTSKSVITVYPSGNYLAASDSEKLIYELYKAMKTENKTVATKLMRLMNTKYIVVRNDLLWDNYPTTDLIMPPGKVVNQLDSMDEVTYLATLDQLNIYKISDKYYVPHFYSSVLPLVVPSYDNFIQALESEQFDPSNNIIFIENQNQNKIIQKINLSTQPNIYFQKINPTKYKIRIENAQEPFYLTFSESFHMGWQAYINTDQIICNPLLKYDNLNVTECKSESRFFENNDLTRIFSNHISEENHYIVNSYANGWYINPQELGTGENFDLTIYFKPQAYFYIGLFISGLTFIMCIGYLIHYARRKI